MWSKTRMDEIARFCALFHAGLRAVGAVRQALEPARAIGT
jgi:hypothetical protein